MTSSSSSSGDTCAALVAGSAGVAVPVACPRLAALLAMCHCVGFPRRCSRSTRSMRPGMFTTMFALLHPQ